MAPRDLNMILVTDAFLKPMHEIKRLCGLLVTRSVSFQLKHFHVISHY